MMLIIIVCCFGFISSSYSADVAKIGIFDFTKILNESSAGKIIQKQIADKNTESRNQLINEKQQIDNMKKDFQREALVLGVEKQNEKARDIRIRENDFIELEKQLAQGFKQLQNDLLSTFQKDITEIVSEIGKKDGYLLILEKKQSGVVYSLDHIDITDTITKQYNKKTAKK